MRLLRAVGPLAHELGLQRENGGNGMEMGMIPGASVALASGLWFCLPAGCTAHGEAACG